jgi:hypothetical protein
MSRFSDGERCGSATSQVFYDTRWLISNFSARLSISSDRHPLVVVVVSLDSWDPLTCWTRSRLSMPISLVRLLVATAALLAPAALLCL